MSSPKDSSDRALRQPSIVRICMGAISASSPLRTTVTSEERLMVYRRYSSVVQLSRTQIKSRMPFATLNDINR